MRSYTIGFDHVKQKAFAQEWTSGVFFGNYVHNPGKRKYFDTLEEAHDYVREKQAEEIGGVTSGKREELL